MLVYLFTSILYTFSFFFFNDTATTEIYTLSLHDALPISMGSWKPFPDTRDAILELQKLVKVVLITNTDDAIIAETERTIDRKSTRLNSSHSQISYAVFCLKKKNSMECLNSSP